MRILAGKLKNREIKTPKGDQTRPTSAKVRGSVFDILQSQIEGANFLDLFAGSGSMGIEALSRGARKATFVERNRLAAQALKKNLNTLQLGDEASLFQVNVFVAVKQLLKQGAQFEIIYIDPPYTLNVALLLALIPPLLKKGGICILEQAKGRNVSIEELKQVDQRTLGDTTLLFFTQAT